MREEKYFVSRIFCEGDLEIMQQFAHIGYVVRDIELSLNAWLSSGYAISIPATFDPIQNVNCLLLSKEGEPNIELVSPGEKGEHPLKSRLNRGGGLDHLCFFTESLEESIRIEKTFGALVICEPVYAITFDSRVAFVLRRSGILIEYLEIKS
jgi:methylmalonyl-CoA/ethylmalonyl-CoA epimerase